MYEYREDGEGAVQLEIREICVRLLWTRDAKDGTRKKFKEKLLSEFAGKLIVDFRRQGGGFVMNDMITRLDDVVQIADLKNEILSTFERSGRRGGSVTEISDSKFRLFDAEMLKGNLTISFYSDQNKVMAQGNPETLRHFAKLYCNALNKLHPGVSITSGQIMSASQPWERESGTESDADELSGPENGDVNAPDTAQDRSDQLHSNVTSEATEIESDSPQVVHDTSDGTVHNIAVSSNDGESEFSRLSNIDEAILNPNETVDKSIFATFQKVIMEEIRDIKEDVKSIVFDLPTLRALKGSFDALEFNFKSEIADLHSQALIQGDEIKRLNSSLSDAHKNIRAQKSASNSLAVEIGKLSDEISQLRLDMTSTQPGSEVNERGLSGTIETLRGDLEDYKLKQQVELTRLQEELRQSDRSQRASSHMPTSERVRESENQEC